MMQEREHSSKHRKKRSERRKKLKQKGRGEAAAAAMFKKKKVSVVDDVFFFGWKMCFCVLCVITYNFLFSDVSYSRFPTTIVRSFQSNISTGTLASRLVISRIIAPLVHSRSSSLLSLQSAARGSTWLCVRAYSESELSAPYCLIYIN